MLDWFATFGRDGSIEFRKKPDSVPERRVRSFFQPVLAVGGLAFRPSCHLDYGAIV